MVKKTDINAAAFAKLDGGSNAFPDQEEYGITIHEYFAAKAMQGLLAAGGGRIIKDIVRLSIDCADEMLLQLAKKEMSEK